jgi:hypothetical protein
MSKRLALLLLLVLFSPSPAHAVFHFISLSEIFAGGGAEPAAQFVELRAYSAFQEQVGGHRVFFYDAAGAPLGTGELFTGNVPPTGFGANQMTILIATSDAAALFGVTPDLLMTSPFIDPRGGKVCWDTIDCFAWGAYTGPPGVGGTAVGTPFPALQPGVSAHRRLDVAGSPTLLEAADDTNSSLNDFVSGFPTPRTNAGATGPEDLDGIAPAQDNCPYQSNAEQLDTDQDGRGNACECGDQSGDGLNTVTDLVAINLAIFNPLLVTPLCDANGDGQCNVADIVAVNIGILAPGSSVCAAQPFPDTP